MLFWELRLLMTWPSSNLSSTSVFDLILVTLFPLAILLIFFHLALDFQWSQLRELCFGFSTPGPFSLTRAYLAYAQYARRSAGELCVMRTSYASLGRAHKRLGNKIGYAAKLDRLKYVTDLNSTVTDGIVKLAEKEYNPSDTIDRNGTAVVTNGDLARVREALRHFVRDWSTEGAKEREKTFAPVMEVLKAIPEAEREKMSVLVPGCGLGRLAWDISNLGFDTTANELSYFMILAFRFLVSPEQTPVINEYSIHPYAHWFSHQRSNDALFRKVNFPDVIPRLSSKFKLVEGDFLKLDHPEETKSSARDNFWDKQANKPTSASNTVGYDYIVTLFFIDTSSNVLLTMEHIYGLLKPGGTWVNLGPLLWTSSGQTKLELSLEEVLAAAREIGFIDDPSIERRTIECEYTSDSLAMMRWTYKAEFWTMRKPI